MASRQDYVDSVLERVLEYERASLFPRDTLLRARTWLNNFKSGDRFIAASLLDKLTLFSDHAVNLLLKSAFAELMNLVLLGAANPSSRSAIFDDFISRARWAFLEGEKPNPVDSGYLMCRKLRDHIGIDEHKIGHPSDMIGLVEDGAPIILVDDFSGTGSQAIETLERKHNGKESLLEFALTSSSRVYLLLVAATKEAKEVVQSKGVQVACSHIIETNAHIQRQEPYPQCPEDITRNIIDTFLDKYSQKLVVPAYMDNPASRAYGFGQLGLTIAFEHCIPDSSLPIYWAEGPDSWTPLKARPRS